MRRIDKVVNIAALISNLIWFVFLMFIAAIFIIIPFYAVFVQGYGGGWLIMSFLSVPCFVMMWDTVLSIRDEWRKR